MKTIQSIILLLMFLTSVASATVIDCNNCTDCTEKIQNASMGDTVRLTVDILDYDCTCINFADKDGVTFDGGGHTITGTRVPGTYGINLPAYSNTNIINNCTITDFWVGIYLYTASYNYIENVTAYDNRDTGITLLYGRDNTICNCSLQKNAYYDFHFRPHLLADCNNTLVNVTGSGDRPIGFYCQSVNLQDLEYASLCLCDADDSVLNNITIRGSDYKRNNGIRMYHTDRAELSNIRSSDNFEGIMLDRSYNNNIMNGDFRYNPQYGVFISSGNFNVIENSTMISNTQAGVYILNSKYNEIKNSTTETGYFGVKIDRSSNTTLSGSHITNNMITGLSISGTGDNLIYNNVFDNGKDVDFIGMPVYANVWNISSQLGPNIVGGLSIGGNYWSSYTGADTNGDDFGEDPYNVHGEGSLNIDYLPLVEPQELICGDVDRNGYVSANDVVETYRRAVDPNYPLLNEWGADVDGNGYVSANDVMEIYRTAVDPNHLLNCITIT